jgi:hypothetical protein
MQIQTPETLISLGSTGLSKVRPSLFTPDQLVAFPHLSDWGIQITGTGHMLEPHVSVLSKFNNEAQKQDCLYVIIGDSAQRQVAEELILDAGDRFEGSFQKDQRLKNILVFEVAARPKKPVESIKGRIVSKGKPTAFHYQVLEPSGRVSGATVESEMGEDIFSATLFDTDGEIQVKYGSSAEAFLKINKLNF